MHLYYGVFSDDVDSDDKREAWLKFYIKKWDPWHRRFVSFCALYVPIVLLGIYYVWLAYLGELCEQAMELNQIDDSDELLSAASYYHDDEDGSSSSSSSSGALGGASEKCVLSTSASVALVATLIWCLLGTLARVHLWWLQSEYEALKFDMSKEKAEKQFFKQWARLEGQALLFLFCAVYLGPVSKCLPYIATKQHDDGLHRSVPLLLWTSFIVMGTLADGGTVSSSSCQRLGEYVLLSIGWIGWVLGVGIATFFHLDNGTITKPLGVWTVCATVCMCICAGACFARESRYYSAITCWVSAPLIVIVSFYWAGGLSGVWTAAIMAACMCVGAGACFARESRYYSAITCWVSAPLIVVFSFYWASGLLGVWTAAIMAACMCVGAGAFRAVWGRDYDFRQPRAYTQGAVCCSLAPMILGLVFFLVDDAGTMPSGSDSTGSWSVDSSSATTTAVDVWTAAIMAACMCVGAGVCLGRESRYYSAITCWVSASLIVIVSFYWAGGLSGVWTAAIMAACICVWAGTCTCFFAYERDRGSERGRDEARVATTCWMLAPLIVIVSLYWTGDLSGTWTVAITVACICAGVGAYQLVRTQTAAERHAWGQSTSQRRPYRQNAVFLSGSMCCVLALVILVGCWILHVWVVWPRDARQNAEVLAASTWQLRLLTARDEDASMNSGSDADYQAFSDTTSVALDGAKMTFAAIWACGSAGVLHYSLPLWRHGYETLESVGRLEKVVDLVSRSVLDLGFWIRCISIALVVRCFSSSSSWMFVVACSVLPFYVVVPLALLLQESIKKRKTRRTPEQETKPEPEKEGPRTTFEDAGSGLIDRYKPEYWWTKSLFLFEKVILAAVVQGCFKWMTKRLWLAIGMAVLSCMMMFITRPYKNQAQSRTEGAGRMFNCIMVCTGAAVETQLLSEDHGTYILAANSCLTVAMFIVCLGPFRLFRMIQHEVLQVRRRVTWNTDWKGIRDMDNDQISDTTADELFSDAVGKKKRKYLVCFHLLEVLEKCKHDKEYRDKWETSCPRLTRDKLDLSELDDDSFFAEDAEDDEAICKLIETLVNKDKRMTLSCINLRNNSNLHKSLPKLAEKLDDLAAATHIQTLTGLDPDVEVEVVDPDVGPVLDCNKHWWSKQTRGPGADEDMLADIVFLAADLRAKSSNRATKDIKHVDISGCQLDSTCVDEIKKTIASEHNMTLLTFGIKNEPPVKIPLNDPKSTNLDYSTRQLDKHAVDLLEVALPTLTSLRDFDISGCEFTSDSGEHDLRRVIRALPPSLCTLKLDGVDIDKDAREALVDAVREGSTTRLQKLQKVTINDGLEIHCRETDGPCLTLGEATGRKLNDAAVALLEAALPTLESLHDFDISGFEFTSDSGEHDLKRLIEVLPKSLRTLKLDGVDIDKDAREALVDAVREGSTTRLQKLQKVTINDGLEIHCRETDGPCLT
eukprot:COSAG06_NODE_2510_length_6740_cov_25.711683_1_plen_1434_part_10